MKVLVIAGGISTERDVSLTSGSLIANALIENGHLVYLIDLYEGTTTTDLDALFQNEKKYKYLVNEHEPDLEELKIKNNNREDLIGPNVLELCKKADIVFNALHGGIGENGELATILSANNIKYTGSNQAASMLAMNKDLTKQILKQNDVSTANWMVYDINKNKPTDINIKVPLVVKPCNNGSSVGVTIVNEKTEFETAIKNTSKYEDKLIIEEYLSGREFSVGILGSDVLPPIEIIPKSGFYDYKNKYQSGLTIEICPAKLTKAEETRIKELALKVHQVLKLGSYSRIDFILNNNEFYCLEANALPGMTPTSLLPQEASAVGISYNELCEIIMKLAN